MTIVGKILVFVNLVFSLVVGGLVMMVYMTRTNWEDAFNKANAQYKAVDADRAQLRADTEAAKKDYDTKLAALQQEKDDAVKARDAAKGEAKRATEELATMKQRERDITSSGQAIAETVEGRRDQVKQLNDDITFLRQEKTKLIEEKNDERKARIQADVEAKTYKNRNLELEAQVRDMARELIKTRSGPSSAGFVVRKKGDENPPPDNVEGRVKDVDPEDGLVKLTIGSDAGLTQGHTLKVFRLHPIPEQSKYLGTIEILMVRPNEAVGRPVGRASFGIRPGDRVASRLLVGGN